MIATSALLPKKVLIAASVVIRRRREAVRVGKIDILGAAVSTPSTMRNAAPSGIGFNVTILLQSGESREWWCLPPARFGLQRGRREAGRYVSRSTIRARCRRARGCAL